MSTIPMGHNLPNSPEEAFNYVLQKIIHSSLSTREAKIKPLLHNFISHPIIHNLLSNDKIPAPTQDNSNNSDLQKIQDNLTSLTKAVESLKKGALSTQKLLAPKHTKGVPPSSSPPLCTYSAIAGSRPPHPSLVLDLAKSGLDKDSHMKLEKLCQAINKGLATITPLQIQLAAVR